MSFNLALTVKDNVLPLSKALDKSIMISLEKLAELTSAQGYHVRPYTQKSLSRLSTLPIEKKENILSQVETTIKILIAGSKIEKINSSNDYPERRFVEQALSFFGYTIKDENFWKTLRNDEFIEIYNSDNIQIFRTFNFFETSSYSMLDLLSNEWFSLWERPSSTMEQMFKVVSHLFSGQIKGITPALVPEHVISEIFNAEDQEQFVSRSSLCKFGVVCAIYNKSDDHTIGGFLVSARVEPVAIGEATKNISFI